MLRQLKRAGGTPAHRKGSETQPWLRSPERGNTNEIRTRGDVKGVRLLGKLWGKKKGKNKGKTRSNKTTKAIVFLLNFVGLVLLRLTPCEFSSKKYEQNKIL